jgi:hypothetical protein
LAEVKAERLRKIEKILETRVKYDIDPKTGYSKSRKLTDIEKKAFLHKIGYKKRNPSKPLNEALESISRFAMNKMKRDVFKAKAWTPKEKTVFRVVEKELRATKAGKAFMKANDGVFFVNKYGIMVAPREDKLLAAYKMRGRKPVMVNDFMQMSLGTVKLLTGNIISADMRNADILIKTKNYKSILNNTGYIEGKTVRDCLSYVDFRKLRGHQTLVSWFAYFNLDGEPQRMSNAFTISPDDVRIKDDFKVQFEHDDVNLNTLLRFASAIRNKIERDLVGKILDRHYTFTSLKTLEKFNERENTLGFTNPVLEARIKKIRDGRIEEFGLDGFRFGLKLELVKERYTKEAKALKKRHNKIMMDTLNYFESEYIDWTKKDLRQEFNKRLRAEGLKPQKFKTWGNKVKLI